MRTGEPRTRRLLVTGVLCPHSGWPVPSSGRCPLLRVACLPPQPGVLQGQLWTERQLSLPGAGQAQKGVSLPPPWGNQAKEQIPRLWVRWVWRASWRPTSLHCQDRHPALPLGPRERAGVGISGPGALAFLLLLLASALARRPGPTPPAVRSSVPGGPRRWPSSLRPLCQPDRSRASVTPLPTAVPWRQRSADRRQNRCGVRPARPGRARPAGLAGPRPAPGGGPATRAPPVLSRPRGEGRNRTPPSQPAGLFRQWPRLSLASGPDPAPRFRAPLRPGLQGRSKSPVGQVASHKHPSGPRPHLSSPRWPRISPWRAALGSGLHDTPQLPGCPK